MLNRTRIITTLFILLIPFINAMSAEPAPTNWLKSINKDLGLMVEGSISSNFYDADSANYSLDSSFVVNPTYKISESIVGTLYLSVDKELDDYRESDWGLSYLGASYKLAKFGKDNMFTLGGTTKAILPFDKPNRLNYQLRTKLIAGPSISADLSKVDIQGVSLVYAVNFGRYFNKYKTARDGSSVSRYSVTNKFIANYTPVEPLAFTIAFLLTDRWTHQGTRSPSSYLLDASTSYSFTKTYSGSIGYTNTAKAFKPDGTSNNVEIFNTEKSVFYLSLAASY